MIEAPNWMRNIYYYDDAVGWWHDYTDRVWIDGVICKRWQNKDFVIFTSSFNFIKFSFLNILLSDEF